MTPTDRTTTTHEAHERQALFQHQHKDRQVLELDVENPRQEDDLCNNLDGEKSALAFLLGESLCATWQRLSANLLDLPTIVKTLKYTCSMVLLLYCTRIIIAGIVAVQTPVAEQIHWIVSLALMWILILWLGLLEGGQGALVGLQPIDSQRYRNSHPMTYQCATMAHRGDNLNRFIVGRQFLVVLVVFALNLCCTVDEASVVPGVPPTIVEALLASGLAVMLITVILGQLAAEVNATTYMLDFINTPIMLVTTWLCLVIESSGILHSCYVVQHVFTAFSPEESQEETSDETTKTTRERLFYWIKVALSAALVTSNMAVIVSALLNGQTTMYEGLPNLANVVIFVGLICFLGMLEAMQIALFAVVNLPKYALDAYPTARSNANLAFQGTNFQAFLIGRQICVTMCMFLLARITTTDVHVDHEPTVLGMPPGLQEYFNTGLPGALVTTVVASLAWRIIASTFPVAFLANPLVYATIQLCLFLEGTGGFSAAWLCAKALQKVIGFRSDEEYLGSLHKKHKHRESDIVDDTTVTLSEASSLDLSESHYGSTSMDSLDEERPMDSLDEERPQAQDF